MLQKIKVGNHYIVAEILRKRNSAVNIILSHGASNNMKSPLINKIFKSLSKKYTILRFNFSFVDNKLKQDDKTNLKEIMACIDYLGNKNIILIGKSLGGALSTLLAGKKAFNIKKVIVLGYPLHRKDKPKSFYSQKHLKKAKLPITFIIGDSDPIGYLNSFKTFLPEYSILSIKNADHSFRPINKGSPKVNHDKVVSRILKELRIFK